MKKKLANISLNHRVELLIGLCLNGTYDPTVTKHHLSTIFISFFEEQNRNGCVINFSEQVGNVNTLILDQILIDNEVSCNGDSDGQASVLVSGGELPYTYFV